MDLREFYEGVIGVTDGKTIQKLVDSSFIRNYKKSEVIFRIGDPVNVLHLLIKGTVIGSFPLNKSDEAIDRIIYEPGFPVFSVKAIEDGSTDVNLTAATACEFVCINMQDAIQIMQNNMELHLLKEKCMNYALKRQQFARRLLLEGSETRVSKFYEEYAPVVHDLTQEQIAMYLGISRSTLNNGLKKMKI